MTNDDPIIAAISHELTTLEVEHQVSFAGILVERAGRRDRKALIRHCQGYILLEIHGFEHGVAIRGPEVLDELVVFDLADPTSIDKMMTTIFPGSTRRCTS
jgi:hypothetical protein